jgi:hypothetical protein
LGVPAEDKYLERIITNRFTAASSKSFAFKGFDSAARFSLL